MFYKTWYNTDIKKLRFTRVFTDTCRHGHDMCRFEIEHFLLVFKIKIFNFFWLLNSSWRQHIRSFVKVLLNLFGF